MKKLFFTIIYIVSISQITFAQNDIEPIEEQQVGDSSSFNMICLYEHNHFISLNTLQFVVGTANLNYEYKFNQRAAIKLGGGTVLGYRILVGDHQTVASGARYAMIEPRWYSFKSRMNCWMHVAFAVSYKYWEYDLKEAVSYDKVTKITTYKEIPTVQQQIGFTIVGKHPVTSGFTFEYEAGIGAGSLSEKLYVTPSFAFSMGWTL